SFLEGRSAGEGYCQGERWGARKVFDGVWDGVVSDEELRSASGADAFQDDGSVEQVRQELQRDRAQLRQGWSGPDSRRCDEAAAGSLELPIHRGNVVPGSV